MLFSTTSHSNTEKPTKNRHAPLVIKFTRITEDVGHYDCVQTTQAKGLMTPAITSRRAPEVGAESQNQAIGNGRKNHLQPIEKIAHGQGREKVNPKPSKRAKKVAQRVGTAFFVVMTAKKTCCCSCERWVHIAYTRLMLLKRTNATNACRRHNNRTDSRSFNKGYENVR